MREIGIDLGDKVRIAAESLIGVLEILQWLHQGFGNEAAAIDAEMPAPIRKRVAETGVRHCLAYHINRALHPKPCA